MNSPVNSGRSSGFILIYVAAILIFLTVLVLHSSREIRSDAQVSARLQEYSLGRDRLVAAASLLQARLALLWARAEIAQRNLTLFTDQPLDGIDVDGVTISFNFEDADLRPDANQLKVTDWERLLRAYGMAEAEAQGEAQRIDELRQQSGGFENMIDLANVPNLPLKLEQGFETSDGERYPALEDLMTVGGASRRLHVADSPLPLFTAFGATPEQVGRLQEVRRQRQPTLADARLIFGVDLAKLVYDGKPQKLRARLEIAGIPMRLEFEVSVSNGQLAVTAPRMSTTA